MVQYEDILEICKYLSHAPNNAQLVILQQVLGHMVQYLKARATNFAMPGILNMTLYLGFCFECRDSLGTGFHAFVLGNHTADSCKLLKSLADHNQVFASGYRAPNLEYAETLTVLDGATLPCSISMSRIAHLHIC